MKYYAVTMDNGDEYGIPAEVIAKNYADYYSSKGEDYLENYNAMMNWFDTDDYEFRDWATSNMDWEEAKEYAVLLGRKHPVPDYEDGWMNGEYRYLIIAEEANHAEIH